MVMTLKRFVFTTFTAKHSDSILFLKCLALPVVSTASSME